MGGREVCFDERAEMERFVVYAMGSLGDAVLVDPCQHSSAEIPVLRAFSDASLRVSNGLHGPVQI